MGVTTGSTGGDPDEGLDMFSIVHLTRDVPGVARWKNDRTCMHMG